MLDKFFYELEPVEHPIMQIPFSGFYDTEHECLLDRAFKELIEELDTTDVSKSVITALDDKFTTYFDYSGCIEEYAKEYVEWFFHYMRSEGYPVSGQFYRLDSPREYNFTTDKIDVTLPWGFVYKMMLDVDTDILSSMIVNRHKSRSGFISFYPPYINIWESIPINVWDENMLYTLFLAYIEARNGQEVASSLEESFVEYAMSEGIHAQILEDNMSGEAETAYLHALDLLEAANG